MRHPLIAAGLVACCLCPCGIPVSSAGQLAPVAAPPDSAAPASADGAATADDWQVLFDGKSLEGWNGDTSVFRVAESAIVGGQTASPIPHNFFLAADQEYDDFELQLEFRIIGEDTNAGIQIRSQRIPDHHEMIGYQADLGRGYWGCLYDESRRRTVLARPDEGLTDTVLKPGEWNRYRIVCEGRHIRLWINDVQTVDYTEPDKSIPQKGLIAVQIHGGPPGEAWYRNIRIRPLKP